MKILESYSAIAKSLLLEDDADRYVHVGGGTYKEKDSRTGEALPNSPSYLKKDGGGYEMVDPDDPRLSKGGEKGGEEEPKGGGMGSGDFERDFDDDETDYGDTRNAQHFSDEPEVHDEPEDDEPDTDDIPSDSPEARLEKIDSEIAEIEDQERILKQYMSGSVSRNARDKYERQEKELLARWRELKQERRALDPPDWMLDDEEEQEESVKVINGKKYKAVKESKQHILKENYERFFGDKK